MAVKLLTYVTRSPDRDDLGLLAAFEEEVFMLAQLRHPNICLFLGVCLESPQRAIVTELVPRGSLWDALRECQLFQKVQYVLCCVVLYMRHCLLSFSPTRLFIGTCSTCTTVFRIAEIFRGPLRCCGGCWKAHVEA